MATAIERFIEKDETDIINQVVDKKIKKVIDRLMAHTFDDEDDVEAELEKVRDEEESTLFENEKEFDELFKNKVGDAAAESGSGEPMSL